MAYTEPVIALLLDSASAATALGEAPDFFEDYRTEKYGEEELATLTSCSELTYFSDENEELYHIGIQHSAGFELPIDTSLFTWEAQMKQKYPHPLIQNAKLTVVSQFC